MTSTRELSDDVIDIRSAKDKKDLDCEDVSDEDALMYIIQASMAASYRSLVREQEEREQRQREWSRRATVIPLGQYKADNGLPLGPHERQYRLPFVSKLRPERSNDRKEETT